MSMSQEEIESLMNGLDITANDSSEDVNEETSDDSTPMSEDDIEALIAQTNASNESSNVKLDNDSIDDLLSELEEKSENTTVSNDDIDDLLAELEQSSSDVNASDEDINDLINSLEVSTDEKGDDENISIDDIDALINDKESSNNDLDDIDSLLNEIEASNNLSSDDESYLKDLDNLNIDTAASNIGEMNTKKDYSNIDVDNYQKVVNLDKINIPTQLDQVNKDSEEKATVIFDILSALLDDNGEIRKGMDVVDNFLTSQKKLLETLNNKFPNVSEFKDSLNNLNEIIGKPSEIKSTTFERDNELFQAMELMQFHDINRQKIERVMSVVTNLSRQLNNILDDNSYDGIPVSKHLPGDKTDEDIVNDDDLESLINEFKK